MLDIITKFQLVAAVFILYVTDQGILGRTLCESFKVTMHLSTINILLTNMPYHYPPAHITLTFIDKGTQVQVPLDGDVETVDEFLDYISKKIHLDRYSFTVHRGTTEVGSSEQDLDYYLLEDEPWTIRCSNDEIYLYDPKDQKYKYFKKNSNIAQVSLAVIAEQGFFGCAPFVDVSNDGNMTEHDWSSNAPYWRRAELGLNVEGKCENRTCQAYGRMVIMNMRFGTFDLLYDRDRCKCPICFNAVVPVTCAFNNCLWRFTGSKASERSPVKGKWREVGNKYCRFDDSAGSQAEWNRLVLYTKEVTKKKEIEEKKCILCMEKMDSGYKLETCGHEFHQKCLYEWKIKCTNCPVCFKHMANVMMANLKGAEVSGDKDNFLTQNNSSFQEEMVFNPYTGCLEVAYVLKKH
jgi:hypothetical protein